MIAFDPSAGSFRLPDNRGASRIFGLALVAALAGLSVAAAVEVGPDGSLRHRIPIEIPPGTCGAAPVLALAYNSRAGDGFAGRGWSLDGLPAIQRIPFGSGINYDGKDTFSGPAGRLVDVSGGKTEYRSAEESWGKYVPAYGGCGAPAGEPCSWTLYERDGGKSVFGGTEDSRIQAVGRGGAVRAWAVSRVEDDHGNAWEVEYDEDAAGGDFYPRRVTYTKGNGLATFRTVELDYEVRPDHLPLFDQGAKVDFDKRLKEISVKVGGQPIRKYRLDYLPAAGPAAVSLLEKVQEIGSDGVSALPAQTFGWLEGSPGFRPATLWLDNGGLNDGHNKPVHEGSTAAGSYSAVAKLLDMNGDGRPDRVAHWDVRSASFGGYGLWVGLNNGRAFAPKTVWIGNRNTNDWVNVPEWALSGGVSAGTVRATLLDMNGDNRPDRVTSFQPDFTMGPDALWVGLNTGQGFAPPTRWWVSARADANHPTWIINGSTFAGLLDVNGDRLPDRVLNADETNAPGLWVALNTGSGFGPLSLWWPAGPQGSHYPEWKDGNGIYVRLVDMNGDGRLDRVAHHNYQTNEPGLWVALNTGSGFAAQSRWLTSVGNAYRNMPMWTSGLNVLADLVDMNGDRLPDRVTHEDYDSVAVSPGLWVALNNGRGFEPKSRWYQANIAWPGELNYPRWGFNDAADIIYGAMLLDMNGDRRPDRLVLQSYPGQVPGLWVSLNTGSGFAPATLWQAAVGSNNRPTSPFWGNVGAYSTQEDVDGDGLPDRVMHNNYERNVFGLWVALNAGQPPLLTAVRNGLGGTVQIGYVRPGTPEFEASLRPDLATCGGGSEAGYGKPCGIADASPRWLVARVTLQNGRGAERNTLYQYGNGRAYPGSQAEQADLGFEWTQETDEETRIAETVWRRQDRPFAGRVAKRQRTAGDGAPVWREEHAYEAAAPFPGVKAVRRTRSEAGEPWPGAPGPAIVHTWAYDAYGFPTRGTECAETECTVTETAYAHDPAAWRLGRTAEVKISGWGVILDWERSVWAGADLARRERFLCPEAAECRSEADGAWVPVSRDRTYDAFGNLTGTADAAGHRTATAYDATFHAFPVSIVDAKGFVATRTWDAAGRLRTATDANGATWTTEYDPLGRPVRTTDPAGQVVVRRYLGYGDANAQHDLAETVEDGQTRWTKRFFDGFREVYRREATGDEGQTTVTESESGFAAGVRFTRVSKPRFAAEPPLWSTTELDPAGRTGRVTFFDGSVTRYAYGPGTVTRTTASGATTEVRDARGQVLRRTDTGGETTVFRYDLLGRATGVTLPGGETLSLAYDGWGRRTGLSDPALGRLAWEYDPAGNLVRSTDALGRATTYAYDELDRLVRKEVPGLPPVVLTYDDPERPYARGRLTRIADGAGTTDFEHDALGRITARTVAFAGLSEPFVQRLRYNALGRPSRLTWPDGSVQEQRYTAGGNLAELRLSNTTQDEVSGNLVYALFSRYTATGLPGRKELVTGVTTDYSYALDRLSRLVTAGPGGDRLQDLTYAYDGAGNVRKITDGRASTLVGGVETSETQAFAYDPLNRLFTAAGAYGSESFAYDPSGNLVTIGGLRDRTLVYAGPRAVSGTGFAATYDAAGNLRTRTLDGIAWAYDYDAENHLVEARKDGQLVAEFAYDHAGERVKKVYHRPAGGTVTTWYVGRGFEARQDSAEATHTETRHLFAGPLGKLASVTREVPGLVGEPQARSLTGDTLSGVPVGTWFYHPTHVGSAEVVSDGDGREATRILYLPFGEMDPDHSVGLDTVTFKYTGQELDEETGLLYYRARYYDPAIGRFLSADPVVPGGGSRRLGFNRYVYLEGNPILYHDPSGHGSSCGDLSWICDGAKKLVNDTVAALKDAVDTVNHAAEAARAELDRAEEKARQERENLEREIQREKENLAREAQRFAEAQATRLLQSLPTLDPVRNFGTFVHQRQDEAAFLQALGHSTSYRLASGLAGQGLFPQRDVDDVAWALEESVWTAVGFVAGAPPGTTTVLRSISAPQDRRPGDLTPLVAAGPGTAPRQEPPAGSTFDSLGVPPNARPWADLPVW